MLEREAPAASDVGLFRFEGFTADSASHRVTSADGDDVGLTAAEFELLITFPERPDRMLSRNQLLDITQRRDARPFDLLVSRLRRKLGEFCDVPILKMQRNGGYQLTIRVEKLEHEA